MLRRATNQDAKTLGKLAVKMWPGHTVDGLTEEFKHLIGKKDAASLPAIANWAICKA